MNVEVRNLVRVDSQNIDMEVKFEGSEEFIPFTASLIDSELYGPELYAKAENGEFGVINEP